jgi:3-isopropylmalate/(R)-2-methylmalate dehydratase small subunit
MSSFTWRLAGRCHKFGHDIPHPGQVVPNWVITGRHMDAETIVPHLFEELRPGFPDVARPGDIIVTGRNFGMGPKMNGYIAMESLGLGLLTESMPFLAYRAALSTGLKVLDHCPGVLDLVDDGDSIEMDFSTGEFTNHTRDLHQRFAPVPVALRPLIEAGGSNGYLRRWWAEHKDPVSHVER